MPKVKWTDQMSEEEEESATWQECAVIYLAFLVMGAMVVGCLGDRLEEQMIQNLMSHSVDVGISAQI